MAKKWKGLKLKSLTSNHKKIGNKIYLTSKWNMRYNIGNIFSRVATLPFETPQLELI
jgi:hypothetical protein